jgi:adenosylhomocysteinase
MDMTFAGTALTLAWLAGREALAPGVHAAPPEIDAEVAGLKLASLGVELDDASAAQVAYRNSWAHGS